MAYIIDNDCNQAPCVCDELADQAEYDYQDREYDDYYDHNSD